MFRGKPLLILALGLLLLLGLFLGTLYLAVERGLRFRTLDAARDAEKALARLLEQEALAMVGAARLAEADPAIRRALADQDREALLAAAGPAWKTLGETARITHFYFITPGAVCLLRMHTPSLHGDQIRRHILEEAMRGGREAWGLELGPLGTPTLRAVRPVRQDGRLLGYLELGKELAHMLPLLREALGADLILVVDKRLLNRTRWEEGLRAARRPGRWDDLSSVVLAGGTMAETPEDILDRLDAPPDRSRTAIFQARSGDRRYQGAALPLREASGTLAGTLGVIQEVTRDRREALAALALPGGAAVLVGLLLLALARGHLGRQQARQDALRDELAVQQEKNRAIRDSLVSKAKALKEANRNLLDFNERKSAFLSSVSHELRTPLTSIFGFCKLIRKEFASQFLPLAQGDPRLAKAGARIAANLDIILQEGLRLTRLINDVLDLAKIETGRMEWQDTLIDPRELLEDALRRIAGQAAATPGVTLAAEIAEDLPPLLADRDRLLQVLLNLLGNAVKFTGQGVITLRAWAGDGEVRLEVEDTGVGIGREELPLIFDRFYQIRRNHTTAGLSKGTGLGLAICLQIVEHYGGSIEVRSEVGRGSCFTVRLPADRSGGGSPGGA